MNRALCHELALADDRDAVTDLLDLVEQVAGEHDGPVAAAQAADQRAHLDNALRVEAVGRLVEDHDLGILDQRRRDGEALLHAHRVGAEPVLRPVSQVDLLERRVDAGV